MEIQSNTTPESPGTYLERKFMIPNGLSQNKLARDLDVTADRINYILNNRRSITADTALRLARYFGTTPRFWLELQLDYDLYMAKQKSEAAIKITVRKNPLLHS